MLNIELPWLTGTHLIERWSMNLEELYEAIFYLHLPVFNSDYGRERKAIRSEGISRSLLKKLEDSQKIFEEGRKKFPLPGEMKEFEEQSPFMPINYFRDIARDFRDIPGDLSFHG
jgi:hypothetical protein